MDSVLPLALTECGGHKKQLRKMRVFRPWPPRGSFRATYGIRDVHGTGTCHAAVRYV